METEESLGWLPLLLPTQEAGRVQGGRGALSFRKRSLGREVFQTFSLLDLSMKQEEVRFNHEIQDWPESGTGTLE